MTAPAFILPEADDASRRAARSRGFNGIESVQVGPEQRRLSIRLLQRAPQLRLSPANVRIDARAGAPHVAVRSVEVDRDESLTVLVDIDRSGDSSTYVLRLVDAGGQPLATFDPLCSSASFRFGARSSLLEDGLDPPERGAAAAVQPQIDYLAKDYASFRKLMLDRLAVTLPDWRERHTPDLGIAVIEVLAYVGDHLSYAQDAVATEAYLETARRRISVRRHVRLVDYRIHEGCNARAWMHIACCRDTTLDDARDLSFVSPAPGRADEATDEDEGAIALDTVPDDGSIVFDVVSPRSLSVFAAHNRIALYGWRRAESTLPVGATTATLLDGFDDGGAASAPSRRLRNLSAGDYLLLSNDCDGDRIGARHHVVRLIDVAPGQDPVGGQLVVNVTWAVEDALPFELTVDAPGRAAGIARGNIVLADHGRRVEREVLGGPWERDARVGQRRQALTLAAWPLTFRKPLSRGLSASALLVPGARDALPQIRLRAIPGRAAGDAPLFSLAELDAPRELSTALAATLRGDYGDDRLLELLARLTSTTLRVLRACIAGDPADEAVASVGAGLHRLLEHWTPRYDLLGSRPYDSHFVVEIDDERQAHLRFGDNVHGRAPSAGSQFFASYRVGSGTMGNVGANALTRIVLRSADVDGLRATNPLPASGGVGAESTDDIRRRAPRAMRAGLERAIIPSDYARLAQSDPEVQGAAAMLRWTGSRDRMVVAIDALGTRPPAPTLLARIAAMLERRRRIGHEVAVVPARYVPIDLALTVRVRPGESTVRVSALLRQRFSANRSAEGIRGIFHPDELTFGQPIRVSRISNVAEAVPGVDSVAVTRLRRWLDVPDAVPDVGDVMMGPLEIARLDGDPALPSNGRFLLKVEGPR